MEIQGLPTTKSISNLSSNIEILNSKLKASTIFNDSTNVAQNNASSKSDLFQEKKKQLEYRPTENMCPSVKEKQILDSNTMSKLATGAHRDTTTIGLSCLPDQRENLCRKNGGHFSLMAVGPVGSGKKTFINTLFGTHAVGNEVEKGPQSTSKVSKYKFEVVEDGFPLKVNIIDTPGFGQMVDNLFAWVPATRYVDDQFKMHLFQEEQPIRKNKEDNRIHCCLYFITPNGTELSQLDICSMKELSKRVNLIPVIAKCDVFDTDDLKRFKKIVRETLSLHSISVCNLILDQSLKEHIHSNMPFAVIGSNEFYENSDGKQVRGRNYKWGLAEVENPNHCDFIILREIIMGSNMLDLILSTEAHYENFRTLYLNDKFKDAIKEKSINEAHISRMDGLEQLVYFHQTLLVGVNETLPEENPVLLDKQLKMKEKFAGIISNQEKRFKEWKKALIDKQTTFNIEIEKLHSKIIKLQDITAHLEAGYVISNESDCDSTDSVQDITNEYNGPKNPFKSPASQPK